LINYNECFWIYFRLTQNRIPSKHWWLSKLGNPEKSPSALKKPQFLDLISKFDHTRELLHSTHGLRMPSEKITFTARPKINSQSQIHKYDRSIFCLPHWPKFSDFFWCMPSLGVSSPCFYKLCFQCHIFIVVYRKHVYFAILTK
jgi:hypothetical protein